MKKELLHFVEWKKVPEEQVEATLADLQAWGVRNIVAHPVWFRDGRGRYVETMAKRLERFGLLDALPRLHHGETESGNRSEESWQRFRGYTA